MTPGRVESGRRGGGMPCPVGGRTSGRGACLAPGPACTPGCGVLGGIGKAQPLSSGLCLRWRTSPLHPFPRNSTSHLVHLLRAQFHLLSRYLLSTFYVQDLVGAVVVSLLDILYPLGASVSGFGPYPWGSPPVPRWGLSCQGGCWFLCLSP